jgi:hypothetical protein
MIIPTNDLFKDTTAAAVTTLASSLRAVAAVAVGKFRSSAPPFSDLALSRTAMGTERLL